MFSLTDDSTYCAAKGTNTVLLPRPSASYLSLHALVKLKNNDTAWLLLEPLLSQTRYLSGIYSFTCPASFLISCLAYHSI